MKLYKDGTVIYIILLVVFFVCLLQLVEFVFQTVLSLEQDLLFCYVLYSVPNIGPCMAEIPHGITSI